MSNFKSILIVGLSTMLTMCAPAASADTLVTHVFNSGKTIIVEQRSDGEVVDAYTFHNSGSGFTSVEPADIVPVTDVAEVIIDDKPVDSGGSVASDSGEPGGDSVDHTVELHQATEKVAEEVAEVPADVKEVVTEEVTEAKDNSFPSESSDSDSGNDGTVVPDAGAAGKAGTDSAPSGDRNQLAAELKDKVGDLRESTGSFFSNSWKFITSFAEEKFGIGAVQEGSATTEQAAVNTSAVSTAPAAGKEVSEPAAEEVPASVPSSEVPSSGGSVTKQ